MLRFDSACCLSLKAFYSKTLQVRLTAFEHVMALCRQGPMPLCCGSCCGLLVCLVCLRRRARCLGWLFVRDLVSACKCSHRTLGQVPPETETRELSSGQADRRTSLLRIFPTFRVPCLASCGDEGDAKATSRRFLTTAWPSKSSFLHLRPG